MVNEKLQEALDKTDDVYQDLVEITNQVVNVYTGEVNKLIKEATDNVDNMTNEDIRMLIVKLSLQSFQFGERHCTALFREAQSTETSPFAPRARNRHGCFGHDNGQASRLTVPTTWLG